MDEGQVAAAGMAEITLENVSRVFPGDVVAVRQLSLEIHDHEFLVLVGPSGCGKSTCLRLIAGLEEPTDGQIRIAGRAVNRLPPKDRNLAMVFQNYALYPHMNVFRNMAFSLQLRQGGWVRYGWLRIFQPLRAERIRQERQQIPERVRRTARMLGIEGLLDRMPRQLSGGERQRVALGRAIVRDPVAFLFDEPLSNLDALLRVDMRRELKRLHQQLQTTMVYVTHDQVEALTLGDRIAVMRGGRLQQVAPPLQVYAHPANRFVAGFIGTPPMNFIEGRLARGTNGWSITTHSQWEIPLSASWFGRMSADALREREVVIGIRPEHISLGPDNGWGNADVQLVEALGDMTIVHAQLPGADPKTIVRSKQDPCSPLRAGDLVRVGWDPARMHLFDAEGGDNLIPKQASNPLASESYN